ncbi:hypothetical protein APHCRT_1149 [Anaplasma phagocytophilum str. CRT53-1]|uniref:Uncharacterized protein n=1 Tax=Anaplasma phagocytophilum str. CRT53-1 TaxID=1359157 RepID=A0A0F3PUM1_ANAPH|nr:hypothetical protein [Anaplasma phagocytophilum]KJV83958.1 hypothetical protein APHCRT_1149 [Anaplasma phagocytophilum str. CRT53-1]
MGFIVSRVSLGLYGVAGPEVYYLREQFCAREEEAYAIDSQ